MKYFFLIGIAFSLSGCGATGSLIGNIVVLPVKVVSGTAKAITKYDDDGSYDAEIPDINQAAPINTYE